MAENSNVDNSTRAQLNPVEVRNTSFKQTPNTSFGQVLRAGIGGTTNAVTGQLGSAGYLIPGSSVVGAAISGIGNVRDSSTGVASGYGGGIGGMGGGGIGGGDVMGMGRAAVGTAPSLAGNTGGLGGVQGSAGIFNNTTSNSSQSLLQATAQLQESNNVFNLQYLGLQTNMNQENREFTTVSNVIKGKNDAAKNTLSNLK